MDEQELQAIEERANKATPGPWGSDIDQDAGYVWVVGSVSADIDLAWCGDNEADAEFIAAARDDVPTLVAEVRRLRALWAAVPVAAIEKVRSAAEMDGYTNDDVEEWLSEFPQAVAP